MKQNYSTQLLIFTIFLAFPAIVMSQNDCDAPSGSALLDVNNVSTLIYTGEATWSGGQQSQYIVPADDGVSPFYSGYFFIGGVTPNNQLLFARGNDSPTSSDFYAGPLNPLTSGVLDDACIDFNEPFLIYEFQSLMHKAYFDCLLDPECDSDEEFPFYDIPPEIVNYPAQVLIDNTFSYDLLPYLDYDSDGIYNPNSGDCPLFSSMTDDADCEECNALRGHQAIITIGNDLAGDHLSSGGNSISLQIQNINYAYSTSDILNDVVFMQKKITHRGSVSLTDGFMGFYMDYDLGNPQDDYIGHDIQRNLSYVYNSDSFDDNGQTAGYGENPPAFGLKLLKGPSNEIENLGFTGFVAPSAGPGLLGSPSTEADHFNYSNGLDLAGTPLLCPNGFNTPFMNAGNTYLTDECDGWNELDLASQGGDRRGISTSAGFEFSAGNTQCVGYALIHSQGEEGQTSAEQTLKMHADEVQSQFNECFSCLSPKVDIQVLEDGIGNYQFYNHNNNGTLEWIINGESSTELFPAVFLNAGEALNVSLTLSNDCGQDTQHLVLQDGALADDSGKETSGDVVFMLQNNELQLSSFQNEVMRVQILDSSGRVLMTKSIIGSGVLDLSSFASGIYIAQVQTQEGQALMVRKFNL